ncbi:MAG: hypothetical protein JNK82_09795 [Myxococcaceae bacterium]|nr:hypothetical protein [Myxococcaceae bacterium]
MSRLILPLAAVLSVTGCASIQIQREKAAAVKTVAIVGFTGVTDLEEKDASGKKKSSGGIGGMVNAINDTSDLMSGELDKRRIAQAESAYTALEKQLQTSVGWKVADRKQLAGVETYSGLLRDNPNTDTLRATGLQRLPDVLRAEVAEQMDAKAVAELCQRLGVDAVAIARVRYVIGDKGGFSIGGIGNQTIYPKAVVDFQLLDGSEQPIWRDRRAEGKPTQVGLESVMGAKNNETETQVLVSAAESGFDALVERYKKQP